MLKDLRDQISRGSMERSRSTVGTVTMLSPEDSQRMAAFITHIRAQKSPTTSSPRARLLTAEEMHGRPSVFDKYIF